jgi:O-antigen/teichoic acid export membrane protein
VGVIQAASTDAGVGVGVGAADLPRLRQAAWWAGKAFWAVLDQGLFAASNFVLGILLARWLSPEQFGSFAVAQSVFLLAGTLHTGLFSEPMLVFGSARHATRFPAYLDILLHAHWRVTGLASLLLVCAALAFRLFASLALAGAFLGVAIASPFILFGWLVRRACLSRLQPQWAAAGGALYLLPLLTGSYALWLVGLLSPFSAFALLGGAGLVSGLWILGQLRHATMSADGESPSRSEVFRDHWSYGRWAVASSGLSWIPGNLYYLLLPAFAGLEAAGALRAVSNLVMPIMVFNEALATLLLPALAAATRAKSRFNRLLAASLTVFVSGSLLYGAVLTVLRIPILNWLYGDAYSHTSAVVPILALLPVSAAFSAVLGSALRALEQPQQVFWAYVASTGITVTVGIGGMSGWGLTGAAVGLFLSSAITPAVCGAFLWVARRRG